MDLSTPRVMGILNITTDSFYEESRVNSPELALEKAEEMIRLGADILDVGAVSSRPGRRPATTSCMTKPTGDSRAAMTYQVSSFKKLPIRSV